MLKLFFSTLFVLLSNCSYAQVFNCTLNDSKVDLERFSSISTGFDLKSYSPDQGYTIPTSFSMILTLEQEFNAIIKLQGQLGGKKISEKKFLKAWWQVDQEDILVHYSVYNRASSPQPNFMMKVDKKNRNVVLFYKSNGKSLPEIAHFDCR